MSVLPVEWFQPQKLANGWKFVCATSLRGLVINEQAAPFFRQLLNLVENEYQLENFHLKIQHNRRKRGQMEVSIFCGDDQIKKPADSVLICSSCEPNHELSRTTLLSEQTHTYAWLDFRNRSKLILTPKRHIERLSELDEQSGEMKAFWQDVVEVIERECDSIDELNYPVLAVNHGTFRKHAHMHMKIDLSKELWESTVVPRHKDKLDYLAQLLKQTALISDCFTEKHLQQEIEKGTIGAELDH